MTVAGAIVARRRGRIPQDSFRLGRWAWPASLGAAAYLALILLDIVYPSGVTSPRAVQKCGAATLSRVTRTGAIVSRSPETSPVVIWRSSTLSAARATASKSGRIVVSGGTK